MDKKKGFDKSSEPPENYYKVKDMLRKLADRCQTLADNLVDRDGRPLHPDDIELIRVVFFQRFKRVAIEAGVLFLALVLISSG